MKVFWSWQSDSPAALNKNFIKDSLQSALELVTGELGLSEPERPELDHDTKDEPGLVEIVATIFRKIDSASAFVADITPVSTTAAGKQVPNPNVMIELGYALKALGPERILLVANAAFGGRPEDLPFDLRHRRGPITYRLESGVPAAKRDSVKQELIKGLGEALKLNLGSALARRGQATEIALHPSRDGDRSTWLAVGEGIAHHNFHGEAGTEQWTLTEGPRAYMRVAPAGWGKARPARRAVQEAPDGKRPWAFGRWTNGDGGANELGVVAVGLNGREPGAVHAVTQWFDKTGELWGFNAMVTDSVDGKVFLGQHRVLRDWATFLDRALAFFEHFGASSPFRVEAGVSGLKNIYWSGHPSEWTRALELDVVSSRQDRDWGPQARIAFLTATYNQLCDAFNQPHLAPEQVAKLLPTIPI
jgi:hypothetical protein